MEIRPIAITDPRATEITLAGGKAGRLARLYQASVPVPFGYCIPAIASQIYRSSGAVPLERKVLTRVLTDILINSEADSLIVRSSALQEDAPNQVFPGIFRSARGIKTPEQLLEALSLCYAALSSPRLHEYSRLMAIPSGSVLLALLIQAEVVPTFSGVLFTEPPISYLKDTEQYLVEFCEGHLETLLAGGKPPAALLVSPSGRITDLSRLEQFAIPPDQNFHKILRSLAEASTKAIEILDESPLDIEWAVSRPGSYYVLQARPVPRPKLEVARRISRDFDAQYAQALQEVLPEIKELGLKAAAMKYFISQHWFNGPTLFLEPNGKIDKFVDKIAHTDFGESGVTIRFSHQRQIGLPRFFAPDVHTTSRIVLEEWEPSWTAIVHAYIPVVRSFELFVGEERQLLEHVPGVWESDSRLPPDVIQIDNGSIQALRVTIPRQAKYEDAQGSTTKFRRPIRKGLLQRWSERLEDYSSTLRTDFYQALPLLVHFVEDEKGSWHFLNIRRAGDVPVPAQLHKEFHTVSTAADLRDWDGRRPILLALTMPRGYEALLAELAELLPREQGLLYIDFGALSHPAIMLREMGLNPIPIYLRHERVLNSTPMFSSGSEQ